MQSETKDIILAGVMGLNLSDVNHAVFIAESTKDIEDIDAFIDFCRDKKEGIDYATKTEKLDTLSQMYKKLQDQAKIPMETAKSFTRRLTYKVEECRTFVKNQIELGNLTPFSMITVQGDKYFTPKELVALHGIGSPALVIELSEQHKLGANLMALFMSKFKSKAKYDVLTDGQKRVKELIKLSSM